MLFKEYHIPMIRSGSKTVTRREWDENYAGPNVGTVVAAKTDLLKPDDKCDCFIRITGKREEYLGEITEASARREGDYDGVEDFRDGYEEVYGEDSWSDDKQVNVVEFEYVGESRPGDDESEQTQLVTDGGETPGDDVFRDLEDLDGQEEVEIECAVGVDGDACDGWEETVSLDAPAIFESERIYLPGFGWECPECGNPHEFAVEGIRVSDLV